MYQLGSVNLDTVHLDVFSVVTLSPPVLLWLEGFGKPKSKSQSSRGTRCGVWSLSSSVLLEADDDDQADKMTKHCILFINSRTPVTSLAGTTTFLSHGSVIFFGIKRSLCLVFCAYCCYSRLYSVSTPIFTSSAVLAWLSYKHLSFYMYNLTYVI